MKSKKEIRLHRRMYRLIRMASRFPLMKYHFHTDTMKKFDGNYIVMSNHATESDMLMLMRAFPRHMYFVCGEHLMRRKMLKQSGNIVIRFPNTRGPMRFPRFMKSLTESKPETT